MDGGLEALRTLISDVEAARDHAWSLVPERDSRPDGWDRWLAASAEWSAALDRLNAWTRRIEDALMGGDSGAADDALDYLEADLFYFWSGYVRRRMARKLSQVQLTSEQKDRARRYVRRCVAGQLHCEHPGLSKLAGAVADNTLRRELRAQLHSNDEGVAIRALRALMAVKHPGYTDTDLAVARAIALRRVSAPWATRFWSSEWEAELRTLATRHGPERAAAKQLLRYVDLRRANQQRRAERRAPMRPDP